MSIIAPISAELGHGIDDLLENLLVVAELADLKADPERPASGVVIEAKLDRNRGPLATVLVQSGTLRIGDHVLARTSWGRVKALANDLGKRVKEATPTTPVEMMGFGSLPEAGDMFEVVPDEKTARDSVKVRTLDKEAERSSSRALTLEGIHTKIDAGEVKELNLVIKADVQGSVEAATSALQRLEDERVKVRILHAASGTITESDVLLASASAAIIIGFGTTTQPGVERLADREGVEIRHYGIIYHLVEDIEKALQGILETIYEEVVHGHAAVRTIFSIGRRGQKIAGCMITDGRISRGSMVRVLRRGQAIHEGTISSLRHFKEEVTEMAAGFECGVGLGGSNDLAEGDVLEIYRRERARR